MIEYPGKYTTAKVMIDEIDPMTAQQINVFVNHPVFTNPVAIMPDTHAGKGSVIGFTMPMGDKVIPNTIGVDIGCGMLSVNLGKPSELDPADTDSIIRALIPFGFDVYKKKPAMNMERKFNWKHVSEQHRKFCLRFNEKFGAKMRPMEYTYDWFLEKCKNINMDPGRANNSIGTLGGGNHFIEMGEDLDGYLWLTIHTGSRQLGERICRYWQSFRATMGRRVAEIEFEIECQKIKDTHRTKADRKKIGGLLKKAKERLGLNLPAKTKELDHVEGPAMEAYLTDMLFAQEYAATNRWVIADRIIENINGFDRSEMTGDVIESVHNYIDFEDFIIRKGAIASYKGQRMVIPFNMEDGILICEGKSNQEWNYSAPHGAGRVYSRSKAKAEFGSKKSMESISSRMNEKGVYSSAIPSDEVKEAYKDPKVIEEAIEPTAEVVNRLKPILNLKSE